MASEKAIPQVPPDTAVVRMLVIIIYCLAFLVTGYRLFHRTRIGLFWWDDFCALLSALFAFGLFFWLIAVRTPLGIISPDSWLIISFMMPQLLNLVVWTTRISISTSLVRIFPSGRIHQLSVGLTLSFALFAVVISGGKFAGCLSTTAWRNSSMPICPLIPGVTITQLVTDIISSLSLVIFPLVLLWRVDLPKTQRRLILILFASNITITIASIVHVASSFTKRQDLFHNFGNLKAAVSLFICNALVVVTRVYMLISKSGSDEMEDVMTRKTPLPPRTQTDTGPILLTMISTQYYDEEQSWDTSEPPSSRDKGP